MQKIQHNKRSKNKKNVKAVILAGNLDFGRCPLASRLHRALWPVAGKPVLQYLIEQLFAQKVRDFVICCNGNSKVLRRSLDVDSRLDVQFLDEPLPRGTAGCVFDAARDGAEEALFVLHANSITVPDIDLMLKRHQQAYADMTVIFNSSSHSNGSVGGEVAGYVCESSILKYIPEVGYCDIKEGLIPKLIREGKKVYAAKVPNDVGSFRTWRQYLRAVGDFLEKSGHRKTVCLGCRRSDNEKVWLGRDVNIHLNARIIGPAVICDSVRISEDAIVLGPAIIGKNVTIGNSSLVENSVLWGRADIREKCQIHNCVVERNAVVAAGCIVDDEVVIHKQKSKFTHAIDKSVSLINDKAGHFNSAVLPLIHSVIAKLPNWAHSDRLGRGVLRDFGIAILIGVFIWSYWPQFADLWSIWRKSDEYSAGLLVPFLGLYVLWARREKIIKCRIRPTMWGLGVFLAAQALRGFGLFYMYSSAERLSLVLTIGSLVLLMFGWQVLARVGSILLFLCLMLPLPRSVHTAVMLPLQNIATASAVFCLEMTGYAVTREGNIIHLNDTVVAVAEACNGLRMVTAFFVIAALLALLVRRPWWEKLVLVVSSLPIALVCNTLRLTITAIAFTELTGDRWERTFHDFGGYAMMPLALAAVVFELWLLKKLTITSDHELQEIIVQKPDY